MPTNVYYASLEFVIFSSAGLSDSCVESCDVEYSTDWSLQCIQNKYIH
jgi:hypothetical protein